jgi:hypothetical protein
VAQATNPDSRVISRPLIRIAGAKRFARPMGHIPTSRDLASPRLCVCSRDFLMVGLRAGVYNRTTREKLPGSRTGGSHFTR